MKVSQLVKTGRGDNVKIDERAYFTKQNGERIDKYRYFIENYDTKYKDYLLASLLVQSSIHNNTGGHFAAYYKKDGIGHFGGKNSNDLKRITEPIRLTPPVIYSNKCDCVISKKDTNEWLRELPKVDIMYLIHLITNILIIFIISYWISLMIGM